MVYAYIIYFLVFWENGFSFNSLFFSARWFNSNRADMTSQYQQQCDAMMAANLAPARADPPASEPGVGTPRGECIAFQSENCLSAFFLDTLIEVYCKAGQQHRSTANTLCGTLWESFPLSLAARHGPGTVWPSKQQQYNSDFDAYRNEVQAMAQTGFLVSVVLPPLRFAALQQGTIRCQPSHFCQTAKLVWCFMRHMQECLSFYDFFPNLRLGGCSAASVAE